MPTTLSFALRLSLWLSVLGMSVWGGGTLYQMSVIGPIWTASPPESLTEFLTHTTWSRTIYNFFGPPFMAARFVPILFLMILVTLLYIYPINEALLIHPTGDLPPDEARAMLQHWILVDRIRFAVGLAGYFSLLRAFQLPL